MKLTEHFTLDSMLRSQAATRMDIREQFLPSQTVINNLKALCENILQPLRTAIGKPVHVTSGYRCKALNQLIGGTIKPPSQHILGQAADIQVEGMTNLEIISAIKKLELPIDQCIEEFGQWVHISHRLANRNQFLKAEKINGKIVYSPL
jgi:zinc D-Ala-D-Ala carboxypeptidase